MRIDLLGLELLKAQEILGQEGIHPRITVTSAPKREHETRGMLRVVYASDDGAELTAAQFLDPIAQRADRNCTEDGV